MKIRMRTTITFEYDADPANYPKRNGEITAHDMAQVDEENFIDDPDSLIEILSDMSVTVKVEPA